MSDEFSPESGTVAPDSLEISAIPDITNGIGSLTKAADKASSTIATGIIFRLDFTLSGMSARSF